MFPSTCFVKRVCVSSGFLMYALFLSSRASGVDTELPIANSFRYFPLAVLVAGQLQCIKTTALVVRLVALSTTQTIYNKENATCYRKYILMMM